LRIKASIHQRSIVVVVIQTIKGVALLVFAFFTRWALGTHAGLGQ
jgi:hypothetical protein